MLTKKSLDEKEAKALPSKTSTKISKSANKKEASGSKLKNAAKEAVETAGKGKKLTKIAESSRGKAEAKKRR